jgi:2-dehydro-3-deoxyphosphogluconate aldolase/(4S)-4-hydroxy-2-oxoglutarate aldolase
MSTDITDVGVLAVVRLNHPMPYEAAVALHAGGITAIEITLTTPGALETIASIRARLNEAVVGAGTVIDATGARNAIAAGARFLVSPTMDDEVARIARDNNVLYMPGAFTPTEMLRAHQLGASLIKVFPAAQIGPGYIRDTLAPLPFLRLVPSGGVSIITAGAWITAGAAAVSVGTSMINERSTASGALAGLTDNARSLVAAVAAARKAMTSP